MTVQSVSSSGKKSNFALPDDLMFTNTIIQRVAKQKEIVVTSVSGKTHVGFITGIDREWIQLTTTQTQRLVLLNLLNIETIEETGFSLRTVKLDLNEKEQEEAKAKIKTYAQTVYVKARDIIRVDRAQRFRSSTKISDNSEEYDDSEELESS